MEKQRYQINGERFTPENDEQLITMIRIMMQTHPNMPLFVEATKKEESMCDLLQRIQEGAWEAQAELSGVGAVCSHMIEYLSGNSLDGDHTLQHLAKLHISAKLKIEEMQEAIEEAEHIENEKEKAAKDIRFNEPIF